MAGENDIISQADHDNIRNYPFIAYKKEIVEC